jgi:hypothetical protein
MQRRLTIEQTWDAVPIPETAQVVLSLRTPPTGGLGVTIEAPFYADPPPDGPPGPRWGLWDHEVVELFLVGQDGQYLEAEFGPHGHHLVLRLSGPRQIVEREITVPYIAEIRGDRWRGEAHLPASLLPSPVVRANAFAIHGEGEARRHLAWSPVPGPRPDFHQPSCFPLV